MKLLCEQLSQKLQNNLTLLVALAVLLLISQAQIGTLAWNIFRLPDIAVMLNRTPEFTFSVANFYFRDNYNLAEAEKYFEHLTKLDPDFPGAWYMLSRIALVQGMYRQSLENIEKELALNPASSYAHYIRGLVLGYLNKLPESETSFKEALKLAPENSDTKWAIYDDLAWIYFRMGEYGKAEVISREGLASFPENPWLLNALGVALLGEDRNKEAAETLAQAQKRAALLTEENFYNAYPGNGPQFAKTGLEDFKKIIAYNAARARGEKASLPPKTTPSFAFISPSGPSDGLIVSACGHSCDPNCYACGTWSQCGQYCGDCAPPEVTCGPQWGDCGGGGCPSDQVPTVKRSGSCSGTYLYTVSCSYDPACAPSCTPSCGPCSVSCGGGTQTCTASNCSTYTQSCNTQSCAPPAPTLSGAAACSPTRVDLSWTSSAGAEDYHIKRCQGSSCNPTTGTELPADNVSPYSDQDPALTEDTTYRYTIRAHDHPSNLYSDYSNYVTATLNCVPALATTLTAVPSSGDSPLNSTLTANPSNGFGSTYNYSFWWNCANLTTSVSVANADPACGAIPPACTSPGVPPGCEEAGDLTCTGNAAGAKCDGMPLTSDPLSQFHQYLLTSMAKVIVERGTESAQAQADVTVNVGASCSAAPSTIRAGDSATWTATDVSGGSGSYTYSWSGTDGLSGSTASMSKTYTTTGTKTGSVTVTSAGQIYTPSCPSVTVNSGIISFGASPNPIDTGQCTKLSWVIAGFSTCTINPGIGSILTTGDTTDTETGNTGDPPDICPNQSTVYELRCNPGSISKTVTVIVGRQPIFKEIPPE